MKRLVFAVFGGLIFPVIYVFIALAICELFPQYFSDTMELFGEATPGWILAPIAIPFWIYNFIRFHHYFGFRFIFDTVWFRTIFTLGFDFLLFAALTYAALWYFGIFKRKTLPTSETPPAPPKF